MLLSSLHAVAWFWPSSHRPDLLSVIQLLGGHTAPAAAAPRALSEHPFCVGGYVVACTALMWGLGKFVNRRMTKKDPADWYQLLRPADVDFVVLTADFTMGGQVILFKGVVLEFRTSRSGDLERVVLGIAARKPLAIAGLPPPEAHPEEVDKNDDDDAGRSLGHGWIEIPGEKVVLQMRDAKSVNLDYFWADYNPPEPEPEGDGDGDGDDDKAL
ncbi:MULTISPECIES: hypothetical protein [unclassified Stenotrophomonas]|nr:MULTISPECIES: hypothetical protein [unclassified Stenotrophomonas]